MFNIRLKEWFASETGTAGVEGAFIFPILLLLMIGVFDIGNGILANQKVMRASQITADLITRERVVDDNKVEESFNAGRIALEPFDRLNYGVDIISIEFDQDENASILWRETRNMAPISDVLTSVLSLAAPNSGVVVVASNYIYEPVFSGFVMTNMALTERAFARGRKGPIVTRE